MSRRQSAEDHGWGGALLGTGWGRPDTFTVATSLAARTTRFKPLIAIRPGYWRPAHFASAAATLDQLSRGRVLVNIVSGQDNLAAYGDTEGDQAERYARTREFMQIVRRLWTEEGVTFRGRYFTVEGSTLSLRPYRAEDGRYPRLYFGGASAAAEQVSAAEADVQLFWGEPLDGVAERIDRLKALAESAGRAHAPLEFGLRITTLVRDTTEEAWRDARRRWPRWRRAPGRTSMTATSARPSARPGSSTWRSGARCSTPASTPLPASSVPAARGPPGWSAATTRWPRRSGGTRTSASPTSCCPTPRTGTKWFRVGDQLLSRLRDPVAA
jgi:alkanesulfonate monooxygenase